VKESVLQEVYDSFKPGGRLEESLPGFEPREEQLRMATMVAECLYTGNPLIVEAPTGIGKTLAYLVPSILSGMTIAISTGTKNLQEQVYYRDLPTVMKALGVHVPTCYIKGRSNYLCLKRFSSAVPFLKKLRFRDEKAGTVLSWAAKTKSGDREEMKTLPDNWPHWREICSSTETCYGQKCPSFNDCFITCLRKKAMASQIIVVNHYLFFADISVRQSSSGEVIPRHDAVILDEGHQIEKVASHYFGLEISNYRVEELIRDVRHTCKEEGIFSDEIEEAGARLEISKSSFFTIFRSRNPSLISRAITSKTHIEKFEEMHASLMEMTSAVRKYIKDSEAFSNYERRGEELSATLEFIMRGDDDSYVYWMEKRGKGTFLHASPIDVSEKLEKTLFKGNKPVVISSATLTTDSSFDYFKSNTGILKAEREYNEVLCSSVFDYSKQAILFVTGDLPEPSKPDFFLKACAVLLELLQTTKGRALILCTSRKNMEEMYRYIAPKLDFPCYMQGNAPKRAILEDFKQNINSILFATGSFWEGVDIPGETLSCLVVDKLPFASPGEPRVEAKINWLKKNKRNSFKEYQVPEAIIALRQGLGRLIRSRSDRGVFAILDSRIVTKYYGKLFIRSLPQCRTTSSIEDIGLFLNSED